HFKIGIVISLLGCLMATCREEYQPPVTNSNANLLVVEGIINPDSTTITLSRTKNLNDTISFIPELNAVIYIEGERGALFQLQAKGNGNYTIGSIALNTSDRYRVRISTLGNSYASEYVDVKITPPIDSLSWQQDTDVSIFLDTHDPSNNSRYYRWEYIETWEHHSYYDTNLGYANGQVYFRDSSQLLNVCWTTAGSSDILLGTSSQLVNDVIEKAPIATIPHGSEKITVRYSILVKQYSLTKDAYGFWQLLRRNTNNVGGIFDAQPSELIGNIRCINKPAEQVIGFVGASTVETKRMFIRRGELSSWNSPSSDFLCAPRVVALDSVEYYLRDTLFSPAYYLSSGGLAIARNPCVDCRRQGGNTIKPSFWP
ncbi:MAG TPA: DUF4249 domain-containing protein, partial [Chitinophagaceae bacterium]|nr:DUF4249 domain-containing protein [Chitinophagaceae bacterium]